MQIAGSRVRVATGIVLLLVSTGLAGWAVWLWRSSSAAPSRQDETDRGERARPPVSIKGSVIEHRQKGQLNWKLSVQEIELSAGGRTFAAERLKDGLIYDVQGKPVLRLTAANAKYNTVRKDFELTGNVTVVVPQRRAVITTEKVQWLPQKQTLRCPGEVTMKAEGLTLTADHLDLIVPTDTVKCTDRVRVKMGEDRHTGRNLSYNLVTHDFTLQDVQGFFAPETTREKLERLR